MNGRTRVKKPKVNRRQFLQYSSALGFSWALGGMMSSCAQTPPKPVPERAIPGGLRIIDPHAHPDQFHTLRPGHIDDSSTLEKIKAVGMAASAFAAVGDLEYFSRSSFVPFYQSTKAQLQRVHDLVKAGKVKIVLKASDVPAGVNPGNPPGAILAIEGGDPLEGKPERVNEFYQMGVRIITVVHYRNNELGDVMAPYGSMNPGPYQNGLTQAGRKVIERMQEAGMVVDVAHAHPKTLKGIAEMNPRPLLDSHTSACPSEDLRRCHRQRTWKDMELIAKTGGVVCTWPFAFDRSDQRRRTFADWAGEILEMKKRLGMDHVGLGTDGGGSIPRFIQGYRDVRDLPQLATAMQDAGLSPEEIKAYMGGNVYRVLHGCIG
jgi:microsomal dipeptidase-like Zn-dependent dipeptidase